MFHKTVLRFLFAIIYRDSAVGIDPQVDTVVLIMVAKDALVTVTLIIGEVPVSPIATVLSPNVLDEVAVFV